MSNSSGGTRRDVKLWTQTFRYGTTWCKLVVVAGPFLYSNLSFGIVRFVNYVGIKIWFVKLMARSRVFCCIFRICVVLVPSALTFA